MSLNVRVLIIGFICGLIFMPIFTCAQFEKPERFTLAGEIIFEKTGDIFLELLTEEQFKRHHDDENESKDKANISDMYAARLTIKIGDKDLAQKKVSFEFKNIPQGTYAIQGIQDVNGNGELDEGLFGPKEPWGASCLVKKPLFRPPRFEEVEFELRHDITDMTIYIN